MKSDSSEEATPVSSCPEESTVLAMWSQGQCLLRLSDAGKFGAGVWPMATAYVFVEQELEQRKGEMPVQILAVLCR